MKVTAATSEAMMAAMTAKGVSQTKLGEAVGRDRSYITKIIQGTIPSIPDDLALAIGNELGIDLLPQGTGSVTVSSTSLQLSLMAESNPQLAGLLETILAMAGGSPTHAYLPSVATESLSEIGEAITRIVHQWEEPTGKFQPKIGADVLTYLREFYRRHQS